MSQQAICATAALSLTRWIDLLLTLETPIARRPGTLRVIALIDLRIRIPQLNSNIPLQLILKPHSLYPRNRLDHRALPVRDMSDSADVDGRLSTDDLRR